MQSWLMQNWDAGQYGKFTEQGVRPGIDLLGRIPTTDPVVVVGPVLEWVRGSVLAPLSAR